VNTLTLLVSLDGTVVLRYCGYTGVSSTQHGSFRTGLYNLAAQITPTAFNASQKLSPSRIRNTRHPAPSVRTAARD